MKSFGFYGAPRRELRTLRPGRPGPFNRDEFPVTENDAVDVAGVKGLGCGHPQLKNNILGGDSGEKGEVGDGQIQRRKQD